MIIDEDKHLHNIERSNWWGEFQIAGELLAAAYVNHLEINKRYHIQTLYAIRVIGTRFAFYKAEVRSDYIDILSEGFPIDRMYIYGYPSQDGFDGHSMSWLYKSRSKKTYPRNIGKFKNFLAPK